MTRQQQELKTTREMHEILQKHYESLKHQHDVYVFLTSSAAGVCQGLVGYLQGCGGFVGLLVARMSA